MSKTGLPSLTEEELKSSFDSIDIDNSGCISILELHGALKRLLIRPQNDELIELMSTLDTNNDGKIDYNEYKTFVKQQELKIQQLFLELDSNKDDKITYNELRNALERNNIQVTDEELRLFMELFTLKSKNTDIKYKDFLNNLILIPQINLDYIFEINKPYLNLDIGEDFTIPDELFKQSNEFSKKSKNIITPLNIFLSGSIAGGVSRTITAPADRLKVIYQSGVLANNKSIFEVIKDIISEGGIRSFWRGNGVNCLKITPESGIKFFSYEYIKPFICEDYNNPKIYERFICGSLAGLIAQTIIYPLEITKTRLALGYTGQYKNILHCLTSIIREGNGIRTLYNGWLASSIGMLPYAGTDLALYNTIKSYIIKYNKKKGNTVLPPSSFEILIAGSISSICGQTMAYPLQLIRTKLQSQGQEVIISGVKIKNIKYNGLLDCIKYTYKNYGILGFYKGITVNFLKSVPAISVSYVVFEKSKQLLSRWI